MENAIHSRVVAHEASGRAAAQSLRRGHLRCQTQQGDMESFQAPAGVAQSQ